MKVTQFKGRIPRLASRLLPDGFAAVCTNARLKTGDLESWKGNTTVNTPSKTGTINSIFPLDLYGRYTPDAGPHWLHWNLSTITRVAKSFAKPPSDDAVKERIFFTTATRARWTDIVAARTGMGTDYPLTSYLLGVKAPTAAPTISSVAVVASPTIDTTYDGTDLGGWKTSQAEPGDTDNIVGINAGEFEFKANQLSGLNKAVWMARDDGFGAAYYSRMRCKFRLTASPDNDGFLIFSFGCDENGAGDLICLRITSSNTGSVFLGSQSSWDTPVFTSAIAMSGTPALGTNYYLSVELTKDFNTNLQTIRVAVGTTLGGSDLFEREFETFVKFVPSTANDPFSRFIVSPLETRNFWYGFSLTTLASSNGPHVSYVDDIDLALVGADAGEGVQVTRYAYTWINSKGEESAPSPLGPIVPDDPELTVNVASIADAAGGDITAYNIVGKRLYRAVTGDRVTVFRLVADQVALPNGTTTYADTTATESLSLVVLESQDWSEPTFNAQDVIALANGILILTSGNHAYPSQPYRPHAYILSQAKTTDWPIVGGIAVENMAVLCTEECPYLMYGDDPAAMSLDKIERVAGCASQRSIVRFGQYGVVYASWEGIIAVQGKSTANLTNPENAPERAIFSDEQWRAYDPSSMQFAVYDDQLFVFWNNGVTSGAFIFNPAYGVVDLVMTATAVYVDPIRNRLFAMVGANIVEFNVGSALQATWRSGIRQLPYPTVFTAAQVRAPTPDTFPASVAFSVFKDGSNTAYDSATRTNDTEFRLLADDTAVAREIQMQAVITGGAVNSLEVAETIDDLS
jgi:hypothetical protein